MAVAIDHDSRQMEDIRHFLQEHSRIDAALQQGPGQARAKLLLEKQEIFETLHSKLKAVKYFQYRNWVFIKAIDKQNLEVVGHPEYINSAGFVRVETLNSYWLNILADCTASNKLDYIEAVDKVLEEGGQIR